MADSSFDIVSKVDAQEIANAINQANKELATRYDFRGTNSEIKLANEKNITLIADTEEKVKAALNILKEKFIKRNVPVKALKTGDPKPSGKQFHIQGELVEGISAENAKKINKKIKDAGPKSIKTQIQGEELRVTSKSRDDLQAVINLLKNTDFEIALQFINYR